MRQEFNDVDGSPIIEWHAGEVPPGVVPEARPADLSLWIVCFCEDGTHPDREFAQREIWGDGHNVIVPAWHTDRAAAVRDLAYAGGTKHIVTRDVHLATGPTKAAA